jgi:uncharacterized membrane protein YgcG
MGVVNSPPSQQTDTPVEIRWATDTGIKKAQEVVRLAELQLEDILAVATSNDARAASWGSAMSAVSAGMLAAAGALIAVASPDWRVCAALIGSSIMFMVAAGVAIWSGGPVEFSVRGFSPENLASRQATLLDLAKWTANDANIRIQRNQKALARSGKCLKLAFKIAAAGIIFPATSLAMLLVCGNLLSPTSSAKLETTADPANESTHQRLFLDKGISRGGGDDGGDGCGGDGGGGDGGGGDGGGGGGGAGVSGTSNSSVRSSQSGSKAKRHGSSVH